MEMTKKWLGSQPQLCDICHGKIGEFFIDGKTVEGPWGMLCTHCHAEHGVGLGTGRGQLYERNDKCEYIKVEG